MPSEIATMPYRAVLAIYDKDHLDANGEPSLVFEKTIHHKTLAGVVGLAYSIGVKSTPEFSTYSQAHGLPSGSRLSLEVDIVLQRFCEECREWFEVTGRCVDHTRTRTLTN